MKVITPVDSGIILSWPFDYPLIVVTHTLREEVQSTTGMINTLKLNNVSSSSLGHDHKSSNSEENDDILKNPTMQ